MKCITNLSVLTCIWLKANRRDGRIGFLRINLEIINLQKTSWLNKNDDHLSSNRIDSKSKNGQSTTPFYVLQHYLFLYVIEKLFQSYFPLRFRFVRPRLVRRKNIILFLNMKSLNLMWQTVMGLRITFWIGFVL